MKQLPIMLTAALSFVAAAHSPTVDECPFYAGAAQGIIEARNHGVPVEKLLPAMIHYYSTCGAKCGVTDGEDMKRLTDFVRQVYMLEVPSGKEIDADAAAAEILDNCVRAANQQGSKRAPMTPDSGVGASGKQIEG